MRAVMFFGLLEWSHDGTVRGILSKNETIPSPKFKLRFSWVISGRTGQPLFYTLTLLMSSGLNPQSGCWSLLMNAQVVAEKGSLFGFLSFDERA